MNFPGLERVAGALSGGIVSKARSSERERRRQALLQAAAAKKAGAQGKGGQQGNAQPNTPRTTATQNIPVSGGSARPSMRSRTWTRILAGTGGQQVQPPAGRPTIPLGGQQPNQLGSQPTQPAAQAGSSPFPSPFSPPPAAGMSGSTMRSSTNTRRGLVPLGGQPQRAPQKPSTSFPASNPWADAAPTAQPEAQPKPMERADIRGRMRTAESLLPITNAIEELKKPLLPPPAQSSAPPAQEPEAAPKKRGGGRKAKPKETDVPVQSPPVIPSGSLGGIVGTPMSTDEAAQLFKGENWRNVGNAQQRAAKANKPKKEK